MTNKSLKHTATKGILWNAVDKFAVQIGQFIIGIILARLLMPEDFGLIGMLSIFILISQSFIDSGMGSGLIQKKNCSDIDFSTVFVFNFVISIIFYALLYIFAPLIAGFFEKPELILLTRVLGINLIINSLVIVQRTKFIIEIDFKTIAKVNVISVIISGVIAVFLAYAGWGVWSLVIQNLLRSFISVLILWISSKWKLSIKFSWDSFKILFSFGSKLLFAGLYAQSIREINNIIIGKIYSASSLGYYTRAKSFAEIISGSVTSIMQQVTYPILSSLQDNKDKLVSVYSRLIRMTAFLIFPAMALLMILAEPFIRLFLTEKWEPVIVLVQWMSLARIFTPISAINMNILNAIGRSDLFLKVDLLKFPIIIIALVITVPISVKAIIIGHVVVSAISFFINAYMPGKLFGYDAIKQIIDMLPIFLATGIMSLFVTLCISLTEILILKLIFGLISGLLSYWLASYLLKNEELKEIKSVIKSLITSMNNNKK